MIAPSSTTDHFNFCAKYSQLSSVPSSPERRFKSISPCRRLFEEGFVVSNGPTSTSNGATINNTTTFSANYPSNNISRYNSFNSVAKDDNGCSGSSTTTTITNQAIVEGLTEILQSSYQRRKSIGGNHQNHSNSHNYNHLTNTTTNNNNTTGFFNIITSTASPFMDDLGFLSSNNNLMKKNSTIYEHENDTENAELLINEGLMSSPMMKPRNCSIRKHWNRRIESISSLSRRSMSESTSKMMSENGLIHHLPCFDSPHDAIKRISPDTLIDLLEGKFSGVYDRLLVIDCRYPYEYEGGQIPTAININDPELIEDLLFQENSEPNTVIVFHCEFSSERAPRMALHARNLDRQHNKACYPALFYPEMYILDGGYKNYWQQHGDKCEPTNAYVPMRCPQYRDQLRYHQKLKHVYKSGQHSTVKRLPPKSKKPRSKSLNIANARKFFNDLITAREGEEDLSFNSTIEEGGWGVPPKTTTTQQHMFPSYTIPMVNSFSSIFASELDIPSEMDLD